MEAVAEAVERHKGELIAVFYTHGHSDHLADEGLLKEAFDVPICCRSADRVLKDGEVLQLGAQNGQFCILLDITRTIFV